MEQPKKNKAKDYTSNVYTALKENLSGFDKTEDQFRQELSNPDYVKNVYKALSENLEGFSKTEQEFSGLVGVKKKSQPVTGSPSAAGSSGLLQNDDPFAPNLPSQQVKQPKQTPTITSDKQPSQFREGSMAWTQEKLKQADPAYDDLYDRFKQAQQVDEAKVAEIQQEVEDEAAGNGFLNNLRKGAATLTSLMPSWLGGTTGKDIDPLYKEKEEAMKLLQEQQLKEKASKQPITPITSEGITNKAKEIKVANRIKSESDSNVRSFLKDAESTTAGPNTPNARQRLQMFQTGEYKTLEEKDKLNLEKQNILRAKADNSAIRLAEINKEVAAAAKEGGAIPEELRNRFEAEATTYQTALKDVIDTHEEYVSNREKLGDAVENLDVFKRSYNWGKNFEGNVLGTTMDMASGVLSAVDYINSLGPSMPGSVFTTLGARDTARKLKSESAELRERIMKPIDVDNINTMEDFGSWLSNTVVAQQVPIYLSVATGAPGLAAIGVSSTGQKYDEMLQEQEAGTADYSMGQLAGIPLAFGATETVSAMVDRYLLKDAGRVLRSATQPERQLIAKGLWDNIKDTSIKIAGNTAKGATYEGLDETATQVAQNLVDIYAGDKEEINIWDNVKNAGAAGAVMGAMIPFSSTIVSTAIKPFNIDNSIQKASAETLRLEQQLNNPELTEGTRAIIQEQLNKSESKLNSLVKKSVKRIESMPDDQFQEVLGLEKEQVRLKKAAQEISLDSTIDDDTKKMLINNLQEDFNTNNQSRIDIIEGRANTNTDNNVPDSSDSENDTAADNAADNANTPVQEDPQPVTPIENETIQETDIAADGDVQSGTTAEQQQDIQPATDDRAGKATAEARREYRLGDSDKAKPYTASLNNGRLEITDSNGNEPSLPTKRKIEELYANDVDFTKGNVAPAVDDVNINPIEHIANTSENAAEVAQALLSVDVDNLINENISYKDRIIAENIGKVNRKSFIENSDANNIGMSLAKSYFNNEGRSLDVLAQEMGDMAGVEITEQDIVDFMLENPNGPQSLLNKVKREAVEPLKQRFSALTGLPAQDKYLQKAVEQLNYNNNYASSLDYLTFDEIAGLDNEYQQFLNQSNEQTGEATQAADGSTEAGVNTEDSAADGTGHGVSGVRDSESRTEESDAGGEINLAEQLQLNKLRDYLNRIDEDLTNFGNDTLGMNIPIVIAKVAVKAMKAAVATAQTSADVLSAGLNAVKKTEWYKNLTRAEQQAIDTNFQENFLDRVATLEDLDTSFDIQQNSRLEQLTERTRTLFQDKLLPVRNLQSRVERFTGRKSNTSNNFSAAEIQMHGKAANDLEQFGETVEALAKKIGKSGLTQEQVSDYLYAMHAKERNAHIREKVDPTNESGSGMSDVKADEVLASYTPEQKSKLEDIAKDVYAIIESTRQKYLEFGLESEQSVNGLRDYFKNYVPLRGFAEDEVTGEEYLSSGRNLSVTGRNNQRAAGRDSKADNILAQVIAQHTDAIIRGRKNEVMQTLYNFVEENPNSDLWKIYSEAKPDTQKINVGGHVKNQPVNMKDNDQYVGVKKDGQQYYIKFINKDLGKAINGATVQKSNFIQKWLNPLNRFLSMALTSFNPEFVISNFSRDLQTAIYNQLSEQDISENSVKGKKLVKETLKLVAPSMRTIFRNETGKTPANAELNKYYEEFKADGAKTGWFYSKDTKDIEKQVQDIIKLETSRKLSKEQAKQALKSITGFVENVNTSVENAIRLSTYVSARKAGVDRQDAAVLAKELTVNFNKSGEWGSTINALYLFFNASIQGTARFAKAMGTLKKTIKDDGTMSYGLNKAQKIAFGMAAFSGLLTLMNQAISEDDDDGESFYKKIPDHVKERNLIIMAPNGKDYYKITLPYGYNIFSNIGTVATEVGSGERKPLNGLGFLTNSTLGAFSPINFSESKSIDNKALKSATPTALKPLADVALNENYFGSSIYNENFPGATPKPDSSLSRPTTPEAFIQMAEFMNEATGGDSHISGKVDIHPETLDYIYRFYVGGTGRFIDNSLYTAGVLKDKAQGEDTDIELRKVPFVRVVAGEPDPFVNQAQYRDRHTEISQLYESYKEATPEQRKAERYKGVPELYRDLKLTDKLLKHQRKRKDKFDDLPKGETRTKGMEQAETKHNALISKFNKKYNKLRE